MRPRSHARSARGGFVLLLCLAITLAGCRSVVPYIPREGLAPMDGFRQGDRVRLEDTAGKEITFTARAEAVLHLATGRKIEATFGAIDLRDGVFSGWTTTGKLIEVDLREIVFLAVSAVDALKTAEFVTGVTLGTAVVLVIVLIVVAIYQGATYSY